MPSHSSKNDQIKKPTNPDLVAENIPISPKKFTRKLNIQVKVPQATRFEIPLNSISSKGKVLLQKKISLISSSS